MNRNAISRFFVMIAVFLGCAALVWGCAAARSTVVEDPAGDDYGPGGYRYPAHPAFPKGSFDLRSVRFYREARHWVFEVEFEGRLETTLVRVGRDDQRELFPQTVDIYLAFLSQENAHREALPGRNLRFAEGSGWSQAVILSPVPALLKQALQKTTQIAGEVLVPERVQVLGKKLRAKVPVLDLGEEPPASMAVVVSGTRFSRSFEVIDAVRGTMAPEGLCLPVEASAGECRLDDPEGLGCAFSGCDPCGAHPQVIDVLAGEGVQERKLKDYDPASGRTAAIEMVTLVGE
jgi:hypothetical protein